VLPLAVAAAYAFVDEHIATTRGFRFAVTKAADAPLSANSLVLRKESKEKEIYDAATGGKLDSSLPMLMWRMRIISAQQHCMILLPKAVLRYVAC